MNPNTKNNFLSFSKERTKTSPETGKIFQEFKRKKPSTKENLMDKNDKNSLTKSTFVNKVETEFKEGFSVEKEILRNELEKTNLELINANKMCIKYKEKGRKIKKEYQSKIENIQQNYQEEKKELLKHSEELELEVSSLQAKIDYLTRLSDESKKEFQRSKKCFEEQIEIQKLNKKQLYENIYQTNHKIMELETQLKKEQEDNIQLINKCQILETNYIKYSNSNNQNSGKEELELQLSTEKERNAKLLKKIEELNKIIQKKEASLKESLLHNTHGKHEKIQEEEIKIQELKILNLKDENEKAKELLDNQKSTINMLTDSQKADKILIKKLEEENSNLVRMISEIEMSLTECSKEKERIKNNSKDVEEINKEQESIINKLEKEIQKLREENIKINEEFIKISSFSRSIEDKHNEEMHTLKEAVELILSNSKME